MYKLKAPSIRIIIFLLSLLLVFASCSKTPKDQSDLSSLSGLSGSGGQSGSGQDSSGDGNLSGSHDSAGSEGSDYTSDYTSQSSFDPDDDSHSGPGGSGGQGGQSSTGSAESSKGEVSNMPEFKADATLYVSVKSGKDTNDGSKDKPYKTIQKAVDMAGPGTKIFIRAGVYYEDVRVKLQGTEEKPILIEAYEKEQVTISGLAPIEGTWTKHSGNIYKIKTEMNLGSQNVVFANNEMLMLARWPNNSAWLERPGRLSQATTNTTLFDGNMPDVDWTGGKLWVYVNWISWTSEIHSCVNKTLTVTDRAPDEWTKLGYGNVADPVRYYIYDHLAALDAEREWFYDKDKKELYVYLPGGADPNKNTVEKKARLTALDLSGSSYVKVKDIHILGADIKGGGLDHVFLDNLKIQDFGYDSDNDKGYASQGDIGIVLNGKYIDISNCEISGSSGGGLKLKGDNHTIFNNYIHDIGYGGTFGSGLQVDGLYGHLAYNTVSRVGAAGIGGNDMRAAIVEYNDFNNCGMVSFDNGTMHWAKNDYMNTEIRYNNLHSGRDAAGYVYLDNACSNILVHHNNVYETDVDNGIPVLLNHPANYIQFYENNVQGYMISTWGWVFTDDTYQVRVYNNRFSEGPYVSGPSVLYGNTLQDFKMLKFPGGEAGHNFVNPPKKPAFQFSNNPYRNLVDSAGFEIRLNYTKWVKTGWKKASIQSARGDSINQDKGFTRTGNSSVRLRGGGPSEDGLQQVITGLEPNTYYEYAGWLKVDAGQQGKIGVKDYGGSDRYHLVNDTKTGWLRKIIVFKTGPSQTKATIYFENISKTEGNVYGDDFGLVRLGKEIPSETPGESLVLDNHFSEATLGHWNLSKAEHVTLKASDNVFGLKVKSLGHASQVTHMGVKANTDYIFGAIGRLSSSQSTAAVVQLRCLNAQGKLIDTVNAQAQIEFKSGSSEKQTVRVTLPAGTASVRVEAVNPSAADFILEEIIFRENVNLIRNPGFEDTNVLVGFDGARNIGIIVKDSSNASNIYKGDRAMQLKPTSSGDSYVHMFVTAAIHERTNYELSAYGKKDSSQRGNATIRVKCESVKAVDIGGFAATLTFNSNTYTQQKAFFTSQPGTTVIKFEFQAPRNAPTFYLDEMGLYEVAQAAVAKTALVLQ